jgi:hypothetical protein
MGDLLARAAQDNAPPRAARLFLRDQTEDLGDSGVVLSVSKSF